jgi:endo-1,4-beta-xylanase
MATELSERQALFVSASLAADANGDGKLDEAEAGLGFATMDTDRDGYVDAAELRQFAVSFLQPFAWVNPIPAQLDLPPGIHHATFDSPSMGHPVGYVIFLPPGYTAERHAKRRYPTVYYLHGGRPGNEARSVGLTRYVYDAMNSGLVPPAIYVFPNGGQVSHYNVPSLGAMGEDLIVHELIPHIDANYRTVGDRSGRAVEGFSQGGRGATRIAFKYPERFASVAAGGPGYAVERAIYENDGVEEDRRGSGGQRYEFGEGNDAYSRAIEFATDTGERPSLAIWIGTKDFNFRATLEYLGFLYALGIEPTRFVVEGLGHNPNHLYEDIGLQLMCFHAEKFAAEGIANGCERAE